VTGALSLAETLYSILVRFDIRSREQTFFGLRGLKLFQIVSTCAFRMKRLVFPRKRVAGAAGLEARLYSSQDGCCYSGSAKVRPGRWEETAGSIQTGCHPASERQPNELSLH
jgi:hypothetical protein